MNMNDPNELPHLSITVRTDYLNEDLLLVLARVKPEWTKEEIKFKKFPNSLSHGIVNTMVACYITSPSNGGIMCRVHGDRFAEYLSQETEIDFILLLRKHYDFAPNILLTFDNGFCYDYIVGKPLSPETVRLEQVWRPIATQMAQMHSIKIPNKLQKTSKLYDFCFTELDKYPEKMTDEKLNIRFQKEFPPRDLFLREQKELIEKFKELNMTCVFSHSDTRLENMVWNQDSGKVTFVDFECCGFQSQAFDIAYHFLCFAGLKDADYSLFPNEELQRQWLEVYLKEHFLRTGRSPNDVTHIKIEKIRIEVMKMYLLLLLITVGEGPRTIESKTMPYDDVDFDIFDLSALSYKEYLRIKDNIKALKVPE